MCSYLRKNPEWLLGGNCLIDGGSGDLTRDGWIVWLLELP